MDYEGREEDRNHLEKVWDNLPDDQRAIFLIMTEIMATLKVIKYTALAGLAFLVITHFWK